MTSRAGRKSNMEALRIFSMFCVLMVHTTFKACGAPGQEEITQAPWESLYFCTIASLSLIGVNCFVLISGYFGIKPRLKGILNFLFIVYFYRFGLYCSGILSAGGGISSKMLLKLLDPFSGEWFVGAYLGMYLLSPMMNAFMEKASREVLRKYVIALLVLELMFGWLVPTWGMISNGYSTLSFCILYMIAGYVRRYVDVKRYSIIHCGLGYVGISALVAVLYVMLMRYAPERYGSSISLHLYTYATPFIIVQSIMLLVMFSKMNFSSRWVNFVAASTFSVDTLQRLCIPALSGMGKICKRDLLALDVDSDGYSVRMCSLFGMHSCRPDQKTVLGTGSKTLHAYKIKRQNILR